MEKTMDRKLECKIWKYMLAAGVVMAALCPAWSGASAQTASVTGRWAATGKTLHNGEQEKTILGLKQDGAQLTGTVQGLGFIEKIRGIVSGNHFEMFGVDWNNEEPFIVGDLVGGELHGKQWGKPF